MGRKHKKPGKKKLEFSKIIFICVSIGTISVAVFFLLHDLEDRRSFPSGPLLDTFLCVRGVGATATGFYYLKCPERE